MFSVRANDIPKGTHCAINPSYYADGWFQIGGCRPLLALSNEMASRYGAKSLEQLTRETAQAQLAGLKDREATERRIRAYEEYRDLREALDRKEQLARLLKEETQLNFD